MLHTEQPSADLQNTWQQCCQADTNTGNCRVTAPIVSSFPPQTGSSSEIMTGISTAAALRKTPPVAPQGGVQAVLTTSPSHGVLSSAPSGSAESLSLSSARDCGYQCYSF